MTSSTSYAYPPQLAQATLVTAAPKTTGQTWVQYTPLRMEGGKWTSSGVTNCGIAFSNGAAASGDTTADIQVRRIAVADGYTYNQVGIVERPWFGRPVNKIAGQAWSYLASIYRDSDPASATFGKCRSGSLSGFAFIGYATIAASADSITGMVGMRFLTTVGQRIPDVDQLQLVDATCYDCGNHPNVVTKSASSGATSAGTLLYEDHDGTITTVAGGGASGKRYLGRTPTTAASGVANVVLISDQQQWNEDVWAAYINGFLGCVLICSRTPAELNSAVVSKPHRQSFLLYQNFTDLAGNGETSTLYIDALYAYSVDGISATPRHSVGMDTPISVVTPPVDGYIPSDTRIVWSAPAAGDASYALIPDVFRKTPSSAWERHRQRPGSGGFPSVSALGGSSAYPLLPMLLPGGTYSLLNILTPSRFAPVRRIWGTCLADVSRSAARLTVTVTDTYLGGFTETHFAMAIAFTDGAQNRWQLEVVDPVVPGIEGKRGGAAISIGTSVFDGATWLLASGNTLLSMVGSHPQYAMTPATGIAGVAISDFDHADGFAPALAPPPYPTIGGSDPILSTATIGDETEVTVVWSPSLTWTGSTRVLDTVQSSSSDCTAIIIRTDTNEHLETTGSVGGSPTYWQDVCWATQGKLFTPVSSTVFSGASPSTAVLTWRWRIRNATASALPITVRLRTVGYIPNDTDDGYVAVSATVSGLIPVT